MHAAYTLATEKGVRLGLSNGESMEVDHVVVAVGIEPRTDLAASARLEIDSVRGGIVTNAELQARSDLWVVRAFA
jgi:apoptosis-inducing factor 1